MTGKEFLRKLKRHAKANKLTFAVDYVKGKGSHAAVFLGDRRTTLRNTKDELKKGTLAAMLHQLGITKEDL